METNLPEKYFSLSELSNSIQSILRKTYSKGYWIKAEIAKLNYYEKTGHCYPDLVEKSEGKILAQMRGIIWASDYFRINKTFIETTKEELSEGMEILFFCKVEYSPVHGLSLIISEISPEFTLGNMLAEKQQTIMRLMNEGVFENNKKLPFPRLPKRIAVISVDTSKGFQDFRKVIDSSRSYHLFYFLFPAILQGDNAIKSIQDALLMILKVKHHFDAVAIIRGGGGDVGLNCYDDFELTRYMANFPLPVLTGIGHSTNQTVSEMVSYRSFITPTELAYFLLGQFEYEKEHIDDLMRSFKANISNTLYYHENILRNFVHSIHERSKETQHQNYLKINNLELKLKHNARNLIENNHFILNHKEEKLRLTDPRELLKKGYSITLLDGKVLKSIKDVKENDKISTVLSDGIIDSQIINNNK